MSNSVELNAVARAGTGKHIAILMLCMAVLGEMCLAADFYGFAAVLTLVSQDLALSASQAGLVQGAFGISFGLGMLYWAPRGRGMTAKRLYLIGLTGSGILMLVQMNANSFLELVVLRLIIGFFDSAVFIGSVKIVMQWFTRERQGLVMGVILGAYSLAITLDFAFGLPYAMSTSWREFFFVLGVLTLAVGVLGQFLVRPGPFSAPHDTAKHGRKVFVEVFRSKWVWVGLLGIFGALFSVAACATWMIPSFIETQNLDPSLAPAIGTIMGLAQVAFLILGGYLSDKLTRISTLLIGVVLTLLAALLCVATTVWPMSFNMLVVVALISGVGVFSGGAIFSLVGEKYGTDLGPSAAGYAEMGGVFATFVAPALMGAILSMTHSFSLAFWSFVIVEAGVLVALLAMTRTERRMAAA
ncbi:MFS transporter [Pusillimonas noertemannii]|uniref:Sugar phosphate permease n=1 Tax=Pusillimonas noertemannii TaxID=305977 RepID=A0A2U1CKB4_9BURK|nr:MFS transporter [Pusillimonas noertemannii]NYT69648.1 MFS transporter [Pusillimonas noertemannii]PVY61428.1 sugar phosphate permease [Pusillimonas noertemannii]TFL08973.1 MFS transporter [Pusillimonas noertemannii]